MARGNDNVYAHDVHVCIASRDTDLGRPHSTLRALPFGACMRSSWCFA
jgi:hypothetical protein